MSRHTVEEAVEAVRNDRPVVVVDEVGGRSTGTVVVAAEGATPEQINFLAKEAGGLICLALTAERCDELGLEPIDRYPQKRVSQSSMISVEARSGVTTGISAADRARTIEVAVDPASRPDDLVSPGHVFPLRAARGGLLERVGRVEGALELVSRSGTRPAAVICEVLGERGELADAAEIAAFASRHGLACVTLVELLDLLADTPGGEAIDIRRKMRDVMGHFATGVSVVTATLPDGRPVGTTANAISSVSLNPPLLLACLATSSKTLWAIKEGGRFGVNVLTIDQQIHSDRLAAKGETLTSEDMEADHKSLGVPLLSDSLATIACEVDAIHRAGDHDIVIGAPIHLSYSRTGAPLIFFRGAYSSIN
jgi:3,4-dihydroxy-2-butanone 4-phosphate synthase